jgi:hypothetical protein
MPKAKKNVAPESPIKEEKKVEEAKTPEKVKKPAKAKEEAKKDNSLPLKKINGRMMTSCREEGSLVIAQDEDRTGYTLPRSEYDAL